MTTMAGTKQHRLSTLLGLSTALILFVAACGSADPAPSPGAAPDSPPADEDDEISFAGETMTFVVPFGAGGGFDRYSRLLASGLENHLGANVIVENQTGAGGLIGVNNLFRAPPDGLTVGLIPGHQMLLASIGQLEGVYFDLAEFSYFGNLARETYATYVRSDAPYETIHDIADDDGFSFAAAGPGDLNHISGEVILALLGTERDTVTGFNATPDMTAAVLRDDLQAYTSSYTASQGPVESGEVRILVQMGVERDPELPDSPALMEYAETEEQAELVQAHVDLLSQARIFAGPPGMPDELVAFYREVFDALMADPAFNEDAEAQDLPLNPVPGQQTADGIIPHVDPVDIYRDVVRDATATED